MTKQTMCVTKFKTISGVKKRVLKYVNKKTKTERQLVVGPKGGISYKSPNSKTRRYVSSICKKSDCSKSFWSEVKRQAHNKKSQTRKKR